jgi:hypothetical protein
VGAIITRGFILWFSPVEGFVADRFMVQVMQRGPNPDPIRVRPPTFMQPYTKPWELIAGRNFMTNWGVPSEFATVSRFP